MGTGRGTRPGGVGVALRGTLSPKNGGGSRIEFSLTELSSSGCGEPRITIGCSWGTDISFATSRGESSRQCLLAGSPLSGVDLTDISGGGMDFFGFGIGC